MPSKKRPLRDIGNTVIDGNHNRNQRRKRNHADKEEKQEMEIDCDDEILVPSKLGRVKTTSHGRTITIGYGELVDMITRIRIACL